MPLKSSTGVCEKDAPLTTSTKVKCYKHVEVSLKETRVALNEIVSLPIFDCRVCEPVDFVLVMVDGNLSL
ncbi:uncharacterized protein G2W53_016395 [Senna tora]|uniref:Uncharacterized protein n=1 Tax=Senna tora TaxID=362788 RepID=A0A834WMY8_9FABA|nr:uncharacterized protein G2W53_016395 [Senna tora]